MTACAPSVPLAAPTKKAPAAAAGVTTAVPGALAGLVPDALDLAQFAVALGEAATPMLANVLRVAREQLEDRGFSRYVRADEAHAWVDGAGAKVEMSCLVSDRDNEVPLTLLAFVSVFPGTAATLLPMTRTQVSLHIGRAGRLPLDGTVGPGCVGGLLADTFIAEERIDDTDGARYIREARERLGSDAATRILLQHCQHSAAGMAGQFEP